MSTFQNKGSSHWLKHANIKQSLWFYTHTHTHWSLGNSLNNIQAKADMGGPHLSLYPCRQEGKHKAPWETQPALMAEHWSCSQIWQKTRTLSLKFGVSTSQRSNFPPGQRRFNGEEAPWWKNTVENKSLWHWRGSHSLFVLPTTWTESLCSNCRVINIRLLWWAAVTLTLISNCCIWFCALYYLCNTG